MKKFIALLLAIVMVLSLAACGGEKDPVSDNGGNNSNDTPVNNEQTQPEETKGGNDEPVVSGGISLNKLMNAPVSPESDFECMDQGNGGLVLLQYLGSSEVVVIPETWNGMPITAISSYVFANDSSVKAIRLADNIEVVMGGAFGLNKNLEIVVCGNSLKKIDEAAFQSCSNLHTVVLNDGLETICGVSFSGCKSLVELEIPASVTEIQPMTFYNGPENLTIIGETGSAAEAYANSEGIAFQAK